MILPYHRKLKQPARRLRSNMTGAEKKLWSKLRLNHLAGCQFNRQKPLGQYIVDFYCPKARLVIEVDGGQHYTEEGKEYDRERSLYLASLGVTVLRFSNAEVTDNLEGCLERILLELRKA